jgi:prephenate dehydrogenase
MTRLAASEWSVWKDICDTNRDEIIDALEELTGEIDLLKGALGSGEYSDLGEAFEDANRFVRDLNEKISGGLGRRWPHM